jgi:hypothetical protein
MECGLTSSVSRSGLLAVSHEHCNHISNSIKSSEFLGYMGVQTAFKEKLFSL